MRIAVHSGSFLVGFFYGKTIADATSNAKSYFKGIGVSYFGFTFDPA